MSFPKLILWLEHIVRQTAWGRGYEVYCDYHDYIIAILTFTCQEGVVRSAWKTIILSPRGGF